MPADLSKSTDIELSRFQHAFWLAIIGLFVAAALAVFLVIHREPDMDTAAEVVAIVGLFTSVIGTLVGAFFGLQIGAAGAEHERSSRRKAEQITRHALAHMSRDDAKMVLDRVDPTA